jgi:hypothetical protein
MQAAKACRPETSLHKFERLVFRQKCGVPKRLVEILSFKVGITGEDIFPRLSGGKPSEPTCNREP